MVYCRPIAAGITDKPNTRPQKKKSNTRPQKKKPNTRPEKKKPTRYAFVTCIKKFWLPSFTWVFMPDLF